MVYLGELNILEKNQLIVEKLLKRMKNNEKSSHFMSRVRGGLILKNIHPC